MKQGIFVFILSLMFVSALISPSVFGQNDVIVPLAVGNYWEYIDSTFFNDTLFVVDTAKLGITGKINIEYQGNNYDVFYWNWFNTNINPPQPEPTKWLIRNQADGLWEYGMLNDTDTLLLQNLSLKFPVNIGDTWPIMAYSITDTNISVSDTLTMECLDIDKEYITPSGTFQCYVYKYQWVILKSYKGNFIHPFNHNDPIYNHPYTKSDTFSVLGYFAPNVGLVGQEANLGAFKTKRYLNSYYIISNVKNSGNELSSFQLYQNYPNPFNPTTHVKFSIPNSSYVLIKIYDILGNGIKVLINEYMYAGSYEIEFNATNLPSGLYFYRIISGEYSQTKKMILLK